jgi:tetratricopeptide (TPR) repeat protein
MNTNDSNKMDVKTNATGIPLVIGSLLARMSRSLHVCVDKNEALLHRYFKFPDAFQRPHCTMLSWRALKDQGRVEYDRGNFEQALSLYQQALSSSSANGLSSTTSILDSQVIMSNIVACRLKLGQNDRAVQDAQECIRLNPSWSKAHVRLASAYIALGRSNDACNALQTAIRHDSSNATARQMLLQQLRRDNRPPVHQQQQSSQQQQQQHPNMDQSNGVEDSNRDSSAGNSTAAGMGDNNNNNNSTRSDAVPPPPSPQHRPATAAAATNLHDDDDVDDTMSLGDRWRANGNRLKHWYTSQSESRQSGIKLLLGLLALYISFGGRFGLLVGDDSRWSSPPSHRGDQYNGRADRAARRHTAAASTGRYHDADDDTYYQRQQEQQQQQRPQRQHHEYRTSQQRPATDDASSYYSSNRGYDGYSSSSSSNGDHHNSYRRSDYDRRSGSSRNYNHRSFNGDSGAPPWRLILLVLVGAYVCRINGINPLPIALVLLRGFGGIGGINGINPLPIALVLLRGFGGIGGIMYGGFGGLGGFGGFGGRPRHYYRQRRGRMW